MSQKYVQMSGEAAAGVKLMRDHVKIIQSISDVGKKFKYKPTVYMGSHLDFLAEIGITDQNGRVTEMGYGICDVYLDLVGPYFGKPGK